eukprot:3160988-Pleurochrysis_carterae.AAC.1
MDAKVLMRTGRTHVLARLHTATQTCACASLQVDAHASCTFTIPSIVRTDWLRERARACTPAHVVACARGDAQAYTHQRLLALMRTLTPAAADLWMVRVSTRSGEAGVQVSRIRWYLALQLRPASCVSTRFQQTRNMQLHASLSLVRRTSRSAFAFARACR